MSIPVWRCQESNQAPVPPLALLGAAQGAFSFTHLPPHPLAWGRGRGRKEYVLLRGCWRLADPPATSWLPPAGLGATDPLTLPPGSGEGTAVAALGET